MDAPTSSSEMNAASREKRASGFPLLGANVGAGDNSNPGLKSPESTEATPARFLNYSEAAAHLGVCERTLRNYVEAGRIRACYFGPKGGRVRFRLEDLILEPLDAPLPTMMPRGPKPRPWYRKSVDAWYVTLNGRQVALGRDRRNAHLKFNKLMRELGREAGKPRGAPQGNSSVYFIRDGEKACIKIGVSVEPRHRRGSLQTGHPGELVLLGTIPGIRADEQELQYRFRDLRVRGEWYRETPELLSAINEMLNNA